MKDNSVNCENQNPQPCEIPLRGMIRLRHEKQYSIGLEEGVLYH